MRIVPVPIFTDILNHILEWFPEPVALYRGMPAKEYHSYVRMAQEGLRWPDVMIRIAGPAFDYRRLGRLYLRAARPDVSGQEAVGWHREEMYGAPKGTLNFWMPVWGVTRGNTIKYIPGSETAEIVTETVAGDVTKGSDGNEIGLLYAPKRIVSGVNFDDARPLEVPYGYAAIFSGSLIHGAAQNNGDDIRFSVDFRIYPEGENGN